MNTFFRIVGIHEIDSNFRHLSLKLTSFFAQGFYVPASMYSNLWELFKKQFM